MHSLKISSKINSGLSFRVVWGSMVSFISRGKETREKKPGILETLDMYRVYYKNLCELLVGQLVFYSQIPSLHLQTPFTSHQFYSGVHNLGFVQDMEIYSYLQSHELNHRKSAYMDPPGV
ncbi:hypothetical protein C7212DRAFT_341413 [Tuber magnatum]|uniref:Uncharacterized protein n=1 Tax=Tuber magnatum TaxID=42249 RepID=A0A317SW48_9PEZI|nr:hypothetical protein C7212DRAFT_341413 [Tuber magnatum]